MGYSHRLFAASVGLALSPIAASVAQPAGGHPDVTHASFHQLLFANDDVAILSNRYPPLGVSDFHGHSRDALFVTVTSAIIDAHPLGQAEGEPRQIPAGTVSFGFAGAEPNVHRVRNAAHQPAQFIAIEIRRPQPSSQPVSERGEGYVQIVDNSRVRAWRITLEPGQSLPALAQRANGVRVVIRGGLLTTTRPGITDQTLMLAPGDVAWQAAGEQRTLTNSGPTIIELVEMEVK